jgi:hypothetical protein
VAGGRLENLVAADRIREKLAGRSPRFRQPGCVARPHLEAGRKTPLLLRQGYLLCGSGAYFGGGDQHGDIERSRGRRRFRRLAYGGLDEDDARRKGGAEEPEVGATDEPVEESDLHAWVDGRQTPGREKAIETYFAAHPEVRKRWWQYAEQKAALRAAFAALATGPIPAGLE